MLRVGLTGGIGSGKSTVARRLVERGAVLVDSDAIAREVVAAGTDGLAAVVEAFGDGVLTADGELDRPALASLVFGDADARARLNAVVHPRVRERSDALIAQAPDGAIVVQDIPLLVEGAMGPLFPLVIVVHAEAEERVRRLVGQRGMPEADARSRIAAQADDDARRAAADVWLDNGGAPGDLVAAVDALWDTRLVPFEAHLRRGEPAGPRPAAIVPPDPSWPAQAARLAARVSAAAGGRAVAHVGPTAVAGLPAEDVIDLLLGADPAADDVRDALVAAGFPPCPGGGHASADPGRPARVHVVESGTPGWRDALIVRDRLRADPSARDEYLAATGRGADGGVAATRSWLDGAAAGARAWAVSSGWSPSLDGVDRPGR
ncbi:dephospho-CoA kinase [Pseudonocardia hydrocarbonoxydans]|nr:dephospho-CoA kinase [Pseudonocardia hydrocarbonoxydans]